VSLLLDGCLSLVLQSVTRCRDLPPNSQQQLHDQYPLLVQPLWRRIHGLDLQLAVVSRISSATQVLHRETQLHVQRYAQLSTLVGKTVMEF
jgi:hypothetical protein